MGKIFVVGHEKGGVGKSSIADSLAIRLQTDGNSVIVVDTDSTASTTQWGQLRKANAIQPHITVAACTDPDSIIELAGKYDCVVVDVGARDYERLRAFSRIANLWVAPSQIGSTDLLSTVNLYKALKAAEHLHVRGHLPLALVLTRTPATWNSTEEAEAREFLKESCPDLYVMNTSIKDRRSWRDAGRVGMGISEMTGSAAAKAVENFDEFYNEVMAFYMKSAKKGR